MLKAGSRPRTPRPSTHTHTPPVQEHVTTQDPARRGMPEDGDVQREQVSGPGMGRRVPRPENLSSNTSQVMLCHRAPPAL